MDSPRPGLDLERELTCSICTELLYQPLTLLDCLHTFCGACLKEWFHFQAETIESSPSPPTPQTVLFTCPSCRASVRDTRHNATVVTLLDMFVAANPDKARSSAEKDEMAAKYRPGDSVLPKIEVRERTAGERQRDEEDERLIREVREMSLRESQGLTSGPPRTRRARESHSAGDRSRSSRDQSADNRRQRAREGRHRPRVGDSARSSTEHLQVEGERSRRRRSESRQRQVEHQSSLRSLISSEDMSERDIEREIEDFARQIQEEGLLEGLDLDNIDLANDDELSRRITEAYRRRQRERTSRPGRRGAADSHHGERRGTQPSEPRRSADGARPSQSRSSSGNHQEDRSRPPTSSSSRDPRNNVNRPRRRTASGGRSSTLPVTATPAPDTNRAARSQTDLPLRVQNPDLAAPRPAFGESRSSSTPTVGASQPPPLELPAPNNAQPSITSFANRLPQGNPINQSGPSSPTEPERPQVRTNYRPSDLAIIHTSTFSPSSTSPTGHQGAKSPLYPEPSITCASCRRAHIEYEVHYNCGTCSSGEWNICLDCYRRGKGCLHWFGFGYGAWKKWEEVRQQRSGTLAQPHMLTACRYLRPPSTPGGAEGRKTLTHDDPSKRLETGTFCARCQAWTNECFWRCDVCNEGDWGFCNDCVNQGKSCSHMLLPLTHDAPQQPGSSERPRTPRSPGRPPAATILTSPHASSIGHFKPLTFATRCDICEVPIQPEQVRYHCFDCTSSLVSDASPGDYDICSTCYGKLVDDGKISEENGYRGWRRCLQGHRMITIGFTDGNVGRWRYVDRDIVGGRGLRSEAYKAPGLEDQGFQKWSWQKQGPQKLERLVTKDVAAQAPRSHGAVVFADVFPPDGGSGQKATARWAWYPQANVEDELLFPRGADVREVEDVNGDWFFGTYMGAKGLFPAPYVHLRQAAEESG